MKLADISLGNFQKKDNRSFFDRLNETATAYPRDKSIVDIFHEMVTKYPNKTAIIDQEVNMSYRELDISSNKLANWLLHQQVVPESIVAIRLKKSCDAIVCIMGILKAGAAYLPIHTDTPTERIRYILNEAAACILISSSEFAKSNIEIQWLCPALHSILHIDSTTIFDDQEKRNDLMDQSLWEFIGSSSEDEIAAGGWYSSYTGEKFTPQEMDEYSDNTLFKLDPYLNTGTKVLEIGCASGLTMYKVAAKVNEYIGTDLSKSIIDYNKEICRTKAFKNIKLRCVEAENILTIGESGLDLVIINSVIQAFNGLNYLRHIINLSITLLKDKGQIFIGDVMDLAKREELIKSVQDYKSRNPAAKSKMSFQQELFVPTGFWEDLRFDIAGIADVQISRKRYSISNELTEFRYDVLLFIDKSIQPRKGDGKNKWQFDRSIIEKFSADFSPLTIKPSALSNVIFTSGTTGVPKGVMIEHRAIVRTAVNAKHILTHSGDVWSQTVELSFDPSTMEIFSSLLNGATLCIISTELLLDINKLKPYVEKNKISILLLITPLFHEYADVCPPLFQIPEKVVIGGSVLSARAVNKIKAIAPAVKILNAYGPTENAVVSTIFHAEGDLLQVPIGKPFSNSGVYIVDEKGGLQSPGLPGELYVFGDGLARGYLNDQQLTDQNFMPDPFTPGQKIYRTGDYARVREDGNLEFLGRVDDQVKIRGHRISLFEIESELKSLPYVEEAVVTAIQQEETLSLCAYYQAHGNISEIEIRTQLEQQLPGYMVPDYFVSLPSFPLNKHAKIDRQALPRPTNRTAKSSYERNYEPPVNETQRQLLTIWKKILKTEAISITDNFFELGGDSINAIQFGAYAKKETLDIEISELFKHPTITELAEYLRNKEGKSTKQNSHIIEFNTKGTGTPIFIIPGIRGRSEFYSDLGASLGNDQPVFGVQYFGILPGEDLLPTTIEKIAHFIVGYIRSKQSSGPYRLIGHSFGGIVAYEIVRQLIKLELEVEQIVIIDTSIELFNKESKSALSSWMISEAITTLSGNALIIPPHEIESISAIEDAWKFIEDKISPFDIDTEQLQSACRLFKLEFTNRNMHYHPTDLIQLPALLIMAQDSKSEDMATGWDIFAPSGLIAYSPGDHFSMLEKRNGKLLASIIQQPFNKPAEP
jgi:amino acid adenylation domain-containing protein